MALSYGDPARSGAARISALAACLLALAGLAAGASTQARAQAVQERATARIAVVVPYIVSRIDAGEFAPPAAAAGDTAVLDLGAVCLVGAASGETRIRLGPPADRPAAPAPEADVRTVAVDGAEVSCRAGRRLLLSADRAAAGLGATRAGQVVTLTFGPE